MFTEQKGRNPSMGGEGVRSADQEMFASTQNNDNTKKKEKEKKSRRSLHSQTVQSFPNVSAEERRLFCPPHAERRLLQAQLGKMKLSQSWWEENRMEKW